MKTPIFKGCATAITTPFIENKGVNFDEFERLIENQIKEGIDAIVVCGTTGESSTMTEQEKKDAIKFAVDTAKQRVPIIAGTGGNNTISSIQMSQYAESIRCKWTFTCYSIL
jgi:4-hydroxy-tetrahydrodipicolinate synthase